jgi:alanine racemase
MKKRVVISRDKIAKNVALARKKAGKTEIYAVLKSNAYGYGLDKLAAELRTNGIRRFAVTEPKDALKLRAAGFLDEEILIIRSTACESDIKDIIKATATAGIGSYDAAVLLNSLAAEEGIVCDAHIKIDTGLGRYGFEPNEIDRIMSIFRFMPNINVTGMYSHYSDPKNKKRCMAQLEAFQSVVSKIREAGFDPGMLHIDASVSFVKGHTELLDAVRLGSALTGHNPILHSAGFMPVASFEAEVSEVRWLPKGHPVGYSNAYVTKRPVKVAYIPVGYYDGFMVGKKDDIFSFRAKAGRFVRAGLALLKPQKAYVLINDKKCKVLGHVGMNHIAVDVTNTECNPGSTAILPTTPFFVHPSIPRNYM